MIVDQTRRRGVDDVIQWIDSMICGTFCAEFALVCSTCFVRAFFAGWSSIPSMCRLSVVGFGLVCDRRSPLQMIVPRCVTKLNAKRTCVFK